MKIEFVYFDLGNVLVAFDHEIACHNLATLTGMTVDRGRQLLFDGLGEEPGLQTQYESGQLTEEAYDQRIRAEADGAWSTEELMLAISDMFTPIESMAKVIAAVRHFVPRVGVLSNTCRAHWQFVRRQPWHVSMVDFDVMILSYEAQSMKPDAGIYEVAERAAGVRPESILFLDDKAENVAAARERGWTAEQCLGGSEAEVALGKHVSGFRVYS